MNHHKSLVVGMIMLGSGAFLLFGDSSSLPLWFTWTVGPLLWYLGFALSVADAIKTIFGHAEAKAAEVEVQHLKASVLRFEKYSRPPAGVLHEIPSMGGFIL